MPDIREVSASAEAPHIVPAAAWTAPHLSRLGSVGEVTHAFTDSGSDSTGSDFLRS
jgi:hypothetical protein